MRKLSIIDIDGMFYHSCRDTLEESISSFKEKLKNCLVKTECTHWVGFTGVGKTFRHKLDPLYKSNRSNRTPMKYFSTLKEWAIAEYHLNVCRDYEADDAVAYFYKNPLDFYYEVICSPDKDLLLNFEGKHFNYTYKLENKEDLNSIIKGWWVETSKEDSELTFWKSMICGDKADNIHGIEGKGEVFATKLFKESKIIEIFINEILNCYKYKYGQSQGIYEFQKNYRLLHLLDSDEDFIREVGKLPNFPIINEVMKQENDLNNIEF